MGNNIDRHYYKVGDRIFFNKIEALYESSKTNTPITWNFFNEEFSKFNWASEPTESLDQLYAQRARMIRESYDYVIVMASGGADSTNVIHSFLRNNIRIDEIIASVPLSGMSSYNTNATDKSHANTVSETVHTQLPLMHEIKNLYPSQKITIHDYFQDIIEYKTDDWLLRSGEWIHPSSAARYTLDREKHLVDLADSGKRVGIVYGIDKPHLATANVDSINHVVLLFNDLALNVPRPAFKREYPNVDNVCFYWYQDPTIPCKQAHVLLRDVLKANNPIKNLFHTKAKVESSTSFENRKRHSKYERAIVPYIYPSTHRKIFQAEKPDNIFMGEHDAWLYRTHGSLDKLSMMVSDAKLLINSINPELFGSEKNGFKLFYQRYKIGEII
jgi:hypothetical protein